MLDKLSVTATGLDHLPAWFLRIGASFFSKPIARLFNRSIARSIVPHQFIHPVAKTTNPVQNSSYRPISITPTLSRTLECVIVRNFLYPAILKSYDSLDFSDQYAFRPTGSTTAALLAILHSVTHLLSSNPYVIVIVLDFTKAFDTVRHAELFQKLTQLDLPDEACNGGLFIRALPLYEIRRSNSRVNEYFCKHHPGFGNRTRHLYSQCYWSKNWHWWKPDAYLCIWFPSVSVFRSVALTI